MIDAELMRALAESPRAALALTRERHPIGDEEGATCNRIEQGFGMCPGELFFARVENCSCHRAPPCFQCTDINWLECPVCEWRARD